MPSRMNAPTREPLFDPKTGALARAWQRYYAQTDVDLSQIVPSESDGVYSTVGGIPTYRTLASLLTSGMVRQVVVGTTSTPTAIASNVYAATGLSATLTPATLTSRILVVAIQNGCRKDTGNTSLQLRLRRDSTTIAQLADGAGDTGSTATNDVGSVMGAAFDQPASTAPVTYSTQFASKANIANARVQANNELSALVLIEVVG